MSGGLGISHNQSFFSDGRAVVVRYLSLGRRTLAVLQIWAAM